MTENNQETVAVDNVPETPVAKRKAPKEIPKIAKAGEKRQLRVTLFPEGGGQPYEVDVEPRDGEFKLDDRQTFKVVRGSVWMGRDGLYRTFAYEGNGQTVNFNTLKGDPIMHPLTLHSVAEANYARQFNDLTRQRGFWKNAGTVGLILVNLLLAFLVLWGVQTLGGGFENLGEDLRGVAEAFRSSATDNAQPGGNGTHQPIAPGER